MSDFSIAGSDMKKAHGYVEESALKVKGYLNSLERDVEELLPGWQSGGSKAFATAHRSWTEKAMTIHNALDDLGQKLSVVGTTTVAGDEAVHQSFNAFSH